MATHGMKLRSASKAKQKPDINADDDTTSHTPHSSQDEEERYPVDTENNQPISSECDEQTRRAAMSLFYQHENEANSDSSIVTPIDDQEDIVHESTPSPPTTSLDDFFPPSPYGRDRRQIYGDRFIPQRDHNLSRDFELMESTPTSSTRNITEQTEQQVQEALDSRRMIFYMRSEILNDPRAYEEFMESEEAIATNVVRTPRRLYHYTSPRAEHRNLSYNHYTDDMNTTPSRSTHDYDTGFDVSATRYRSSPVSETGLRILNAHQRQTRYINRTAIKILDAPDLQDDFYLNLVDWGPDDCLAVGLGTCVYLWDANTSRVTKLCDFMTEQVTSVSWAQRGKHLAIGTNRAKLCLWDINESKQVRTWQNHQSRLGALAWNMNIITSGGRDHHIFHHDVRSQAAYFRDMHAHRQEVCGLKWSPDGTMLASGGNDNKLMVWNSHEDLLINRFGQHRAAVKAIAWCPYDRSMLVSGGGTADKTIKFWNAHRGVMLDSYDTGSQVCNIAWSKRSKELVSTHGFANHHVQSSNQVVVWNAKSMNRVATLTGHTKRVLFMAMNGSGSTVATGAADETLRFWDVFQTIDENKKEVKRTSVLR
ncbi:cell cycle regulatory protein [Halteromyces radiatus]|uniref:cell cycle regulatory protein n=1 Tax=Halteromyces radiatus TaxID=101107 RepID=UPI00221EB751|nr:cell cycle regulatory protein [Halteromyces radiatus]KAI8089067.1 cell cycle regulatory protein [Halteromyces radiatus]